MNAKIKTSIAALFLAITVGEAMIIQGGNEQRAGAATEAAATTAAVGQAAPEFTLSDTKGKNHSLSQYKGKFVVLEWVNFDCPFVKKHYSGGNMQTLQNSYTKKGVVWLSINSSAPNKQGNYSGAQVDAMIKERKAAPTAYLLDPEGTVGHMYGAKATPHMFVVDKGGKLVYAGAIDDISSVDPEDIKKARNYVAEALDASMKGKPVKTASTNAYGCSVKYAK